MMEDLDQFVIGLSEVLMIQEVLDVFLDDLHGLLVDRKIDFTINLVANIEPISMPPYHMALVELKKLKT